MLGIQERSVTKIYNSSTPVQSLFMRCLKADLYKLITILQAGLVLVKQIIKNLKVQLTKIWK